MSASGKSSNRHSEERRARSCGSGHGIYAADGIRAYERERERRTVAADRPASPRPLPTVKPAAPKPKRPAEPVPLALIGLGIVAAHVAGSLAEHVRQHKSR